MSAMDPSMRGKQVVLYARVGYPGSRTSDILIGAHKVEVPNGELERAISPPPWVRTLQQQVQDLLVAGTEKLEEIRRLRRETTFDLKISTMDVVKMMPVVADLVLKAAWLAGPEGAKLDDPTWEREALEMCRAAEQVVNDTVPPAEVWEHADGGRYHIVEEGELKHPSTDEWVKSVSYRSVDGGPLYTTTQDRWGVRFKRVP